MKRKNAGVGEEVVKPNDYRSIRKAVSLKRGMSCSSDRIHSNQSGP